MSTQSKFILLGITIFLCIFWTHLHRELYNTYSGYTPEQTIQAYHDAYVDKDVDIVCFLAHSNSTQQNIPELPNNGVLIFAWVDSVITFQMKTYVYSTFKYGTWDISGEPLITCARIREALYYENNVWRVGLGNIIDIGCLNRIKNIDYVNTRV